MTTSQPESGQVFKSLLFTVIIPSLILAKLSTEERLGPTTAFFVALSFPLLFGLKDIISKRKANFFAIFGLLNVGITGGFGLLQMDGIWFAVKEAAFPLILGLGVIISQWTKSPLVHTLILNESIFDLPKIRGRLEQHNRVLEFKQLTARVTWLFASSFFLSAVLNFGLARYVLRSPTGTPEFNAELGQMTALSLPVISLPVIIFTLGVFWHLFSQLSKLTMLPKEELLINKTQNVG
ncbi:MAG: hypothetical protein RJB13_401 [Pseudomonadota bacterium]